jgi:hypothetical protein
LLKFLLSSELKFSGVRHLFPASQPDKGFPYGIAIDKKYGKGTALFLYRLAHPLHKKDQIAPKESFTEIELNTLKDAARRGSKVYEAIYYELRPHHRMP